MEKRKAAAFAGRDAFRGQKLIFHVANGKVLPTPMGNDQGGAGESALRRGSGVVGVGGGASRRKTKSTVPLKRQGSGMRSTRAPDAFPAPAGGVVVFRPPRKSSTAWKSNSAVFHAMEVKLCGFSTAWKPLFRKVPRHGTHFCPRCPRPPQDKPPRVSSPPLFPHHGTHFRPFSNDWKKFSGSHKGHKGIKGCGRDAGGVRMGIYKNGEKTASRTRTRSVEELKG